MDFTGEFGASFVRPPSLAGTHAAMIAALVAGALVALRHRGAVVAALRATYGTSASPLDLAVLRIAVCIGLAAKLSLDQALFCSELPRVLMLPPYGMTTIAALLPPSRPLVAVAGHVLELCLVAGLVGFRTRTAMAAACVLGTYVLGVPTLYGKVNHHNHLLWFAALLAASDSGAALSVDAWLRRRRGSAPPGPSPAFGLPLAVARLLIGLVYFFPGWWKLWLSGPDWFLGDTVRNVMQNLWFVGLGSPRPGLLASRGLLVAAGVAVIAFELSFVFLIHVRRLRPLAALAGLGFHLAAGLALNIWFAALVLSYVVFIDWARVARRPEGAARPAPGRPIRPALVATSLALVTGVVWTGALARTTAWPFACYPIFAPSPLPRMQTLRLVAVDAEGGESPVGDGELRRRMGAERWARLVQRIAATEDEGLRGARAAALVETWRRTAGVAATRLRLYVETHTTVVGEAGRNPLERAVLLEARSDGAAHDRADPSVRPRSRREHGVPRGAGPAVVRALASRP